MANSVKLEVTGVRYFETFRGVGYEATTNVENVKIWNDGYGGGSWIPQNKPYTTPYLKLTEIELESLIDDYEKKIDDRLEKTIQKYKMPINGSKSSDAYDESRLEEHNHELESQVEWYNFFVDYVHKANKNLYNDACEYADNKQIGN